MDTVTIIFLVGGTVLFFGVIATFTVALIRGGLD